MTENYSKGKIIIYTAEDGSVSLETKLEDDTIWLTQDMIAILFGSSKSNISEHISHIYEEGELQKMSTVRKFRTVRKEGNRNVSRNIEYYNLDLILSVGYRVKTKVATQFRIWANNVLKQYLTQGYAVNKKILEAQNEKLEALKTSINLLSRSVSNQISSLDDARLAVRMLDDFAKGLDLLDSFDHKTLDTKGLTQKSVIKVSREEFLNIINRMKSKFASDIFANPKDGSFDSSINQIYQTFGGQECYPSIEEKAAMLLYLITKNHSFSDGNKRIAASCFLYFLEKNGILYRDNKPVIDNAALFALTLLIAESNPSEMDVMKQIVISLLNSN